MLDLTATYSTVQSSPTPKRGKINNYLNTSTFNLINKLTSVQKMLEMVDLNYLT